MTLSSNSSLIYFRGTSQVHILPPGSRELPPPRSGPPHPQPPPLGAIPAHQPPMASPREAPRPLPVENGLDYHHQMVNRGRDPPPGGAQLLAVAPMRANAGPPPPARQSSYPPRSLPHPHHYPQSYQIVSPPATTSTSMVTLDRSSQQRLRPQGSGQHGQPPER